MCGGSVPPGILLQCMRFHPGSPLFHGCLRAIGNVISNSVLARNSVSDGPLRPPRLRQFRVETRTLNPVSTFSGNRHGGKNNDLFLLLTLASEESGEREAEVLAGVLALGVDLPDVQLGGGVVLGADDTCCFLQIFTSIMLLSSPKTASHAQHL